MQGLRPVEYPAIARAQRLTAQRLGGGSGNIKGRRRCDTAPAESFDLGSEQRSLLHVPENDDDPTSSPQWRWFSGSAGKQGKAGRSHDSGQYQKRRCSLEQRGSPLFGRDDDEGSELEDDDAHMGVGYSRDEEKRSPSLERTFREMDTLTLKVREDALALERFLAGEAAPAVQKVFDAAVAQHAHACRLLSVENLPLPPPPSQVAAAAREKRGSQNYNHSSKIKVNTSVNTSTKSSQHYDALHDSNDDHKQQSAGRRAFAEGGGRSKRRLSSDSPASLASMAEQARRQEKGEDAEETSRCEGDSKLNASALASSETSKDMGIAVVEVLQVSARSGPEAGTKERSSGKGVEDEETDESESGGGGRSRPVQTDISAKIVGLSTLIRKKAAEASASRWRKY